MSILRRHVAVICPDAGGAGSVAAVARRQAQGLSCFFDTTLISDTHFAKQAGDPEALVIKPPLFDWLRRYAHVPREFAFAYHSRRALIHLNEQRRLNFVFCHGHPVAALAAAPVQKSLGIRFGLVTHGDISDRPKGTYDRRLTWFYRRVTPIAYRRADLIVALSPHMQSLARQGGAADEKIQLIPNGIDVSELGFDQGPVEPPLPRPGSPLRVLFVGRLNIEKGVDTLLAACNQLSRRGIAFELRLAGDGPLRKILQETASQLGLADHVCFLGLLPRHQLGMEYRWCHAVCVPSRSDPLPTVVIEAMSAGRPVVGSAVGGISWSIENENSGILVRPDDPATLADALERIASHPEMAGSMGQYGQQICLKRFNWTRIIPQLAQAIDDTITRP